MPLPNIANIPTFSILKNNRKVDTLKHCFLENVIISTNALPTTLRAKNGELYECIYDSCFLVADNRNGATMQFIASFQAHTYGNFVVLRGNKFLNLPKIQTKNHESQF